MMFTPEQRRTVVPAVRRELADTFLDLNHRFGPKKPTAVLRVFKIMVGVMFFHLPARVMTWASEVEGGAQWALRWITRQRRAAFGHKRGSPDALCPTPPPPPPDAVLLGPERQNDEVNVLEVT